MGTKRNIFCPCEDDSSVRTCLHNVFMVINASRMDHQLLSVGTKDYGDYSPNLAHRYFKTNRRLTKMQMIQTLNLLRLQVKMLR